MTMPANPIDAARASLSEDQPLLHVMLVYEDFPMAVQGKRIYDLIAREAGGEEAVQLTVWRFDFFHSPEMNCAVSHQAEQADVIIVATRDADHLPPHVRTWLERWPDKRTQHTGALVAVFHSTAAPYARSSHAALLLSRAARRGNMDFLCEVGGGEGAVQAPTIMTSQVTETQRPSYRNWGLND